MILHLPSRSVVFLHDCVKGRIFVVVLICSETLENEVVRCFWNPRRGFGRGFGALRMLVKCRIEDLLKVLNILNVLKSPKSSGKGPKRPRGLAKSPKHPKKS